MGVNVSNIENNEIKDMCKYPGLSPINLLKIKRMFQTNQTIQIDKTKLMEILEINKFETDIVFEFFDIDGNGFIDSYEFICCTALLTHSSVEIKAELLFKLFDEGQNNLLSRDSLSYLATNYLMTKNIQPDKQTLNEYTNGIMIKANLHQDNQLTLEEFESFLKKDRELLNIFSGFNCLLDSDNHLQSTKTMAAEVSGEDSDIEKERFKGKEERNEVKQKIKEGAEFYMKSENKFEEEIMAGTEFSAVKPWKAVVLNSVPSNYEPDPHEGQQSDSLLQLEFIHGYRCHDTRDNLRYNTNGDIVYHSAAVGIVLNKQQRKQGYFFEHLDDIISLAVHPNKQYIATGEIGPHPLIAVWDSESFECLSRFSFPLVKGISNLCFSEDGKLLCASSSDDDHSIAVFEWEKCEIVESKKEKKSKDKIKGLIATGKGTRSVILSLCFNKNNDCVVASCIKEINLVSFEKGEIKLKKATGLKADQLQSFLCSAFLDNTRFIVGTFKGDLFLFNSGSYTKSLKAHEGSINSIYVTKSEFLTGGNDGLVLIWDMEFTVKSKININESTINSLCPKVRSVCVNENNDVLIGTRAGEIIEYCSGTYNVIIRGHFDFELWAICMHPEKDIYYTAGQDKLLAEWDIESRSILRYIKLDISADRIACSPNGKDLAISNNKGEFLIYDTQNLTLKLTKKDRKDPISLVKYSPNGKYLAVGGVDMLIYIYEVGKNYILKSKLKGHVSRVCHLDFDNESNIIQSTSSSYDILYHDLNLGKLVQGGASAFKDNDWNTWNIVFGWPVQGIWPPCCSGDDINSVDRDKDNKVLATGDDFGKVKLFRYPCPVEKASFNPYIGHSSHVTCVRFSASNNYLISTGGNDKSIFQWKFIKDEEVNEIIEDADNLDEEENTSSSLIVEKLQGTQFGASKPFLGEVKASTPKNYVPSKGAGDCPKENIKLKYIHGYRGFDSKDNVKFTSNGQVLFHSAAVDIVLDIESNTQTFFTSHDEDIVSLAIHPNGKIAASGQMAKAGKAKLIDIYVFDVETKEVISNLKGFHLRAVKLLTFSPDGSKLLSGGQDDNNSIAIHDWKSSKLLASSPVDKAKLTGCAFKNENEFVTVGLKSIKFWKISGRNISSQKGVFGNEPANAQLSIAFSFVSKSCITGDEKGNIIIWNDRKALKSKKISSSSVWVLLSKKDNLYTGCQDGQVRIFNENLDQLRSISVNKLTTFNPGVRALDINENNNILIGTRGCEIILFNELNKTRKFIVRSHYDAELWGLAICPINPFLLATGGDDHTLRIYNSSTNRMIKHLILEHDFRCIDWSSDGKFIVVGSMFGKIFYIKIPEMEVVSSYISIFKKKEEWIQEIKISPNNHFVAYGSHGSSFKIEILNILDNGQFSQYAVINARVTSAITHLDWSVNSDFLVINSLAFELKFISLYDKKVITASNANEIDWNTWTCIFGFPVQGIWNPDATGYSVNYSCMSFNKKVVVTGDDYGFVKIFKSPCTVNNANSNIFKGHSSHIPKVRFSKDDLFLYSVGGNDKSLFVWETDFGMINESSYKELFIEEKDKDLRKGKEYQETIIEVTEGNKEDDLMKKLTMNFEESNNNKLKEETKGKEVVEMNNLLNEEEEMVGDQKLTMELWRGNVFEPSYAKSLSNDIKTPPTITPVTEFVFGYRSRETRNNLKYLDSKTIAYHAGSIVIIHDLSNNTQTHFYKHKEEILGFSVCTNKTIIAAHDVVKSKTSNKPLLVVWDYNKREEIMTLENLNSKGASSMAFDIDGNFLICLGADEDHTISVVSVNEKKVIFSDKCGKSRVLDACFMDKNEFAVVGMNFFSIWNNEGSTFIKKNVNIKQSDKFGVISTIGCNYITGGGNGEITIWEGLDIKITKPIHKKPIDTIRIVREHVISAGRDSMMFLLNNNLETIRMIDLTKINLDSLLLYVMSIDVSQDNQKLLIGTISSEIYELNFQEVSNFLEGEFTVKTILTAHSSVSTNSSNSNECTALCFLPKNNVFISTGEDWTLRLWENATNRIQHLIRLDKDKEPRKVKGYPRCIDVDIEEKSICVGFKEDFAKIFAYPEFTLIKKVVLKEGANEVKYSPCGKYLAIGSNDKMIYILDTRKNEKIQSLQGHQASITKLNWSLDSQYIMSNSASGEMLFWDIKIWKQFQKGGQLLKDEMWDKWSCLFGWFDSYKIRVVQGAWVSSYNVSDVFYITRSKNSKLLALSDVSGLKLSRFPFFSPQQKYIEMYSHSSAVSSMCFDINDKYLISLGAYDGCIIKWRLEEI